MWSLGNCELTDVWWIRVSLMRFDPMLNSGLSLKSSNEVASMFRKSLAVCISLAFAVSLAAAGGETPSQVKLSAAAIVEKNVAARGGLQAWREIGRAHV